MSSAYLGATGSAVLSNIWQIFPDQTTAEPGAGKQHETKMSVFKDSSSIGTEHTVSKQHLLGFRNIFPTGFYWHALIFFFFQNSDAFFPTKF